MELLTILNPWWKEGTISKELALPYRRKVYYSVRDLLGLKQIIVISGLRRVGKINFETIVASLLDAKYYWRENGKEVDFLVVNDQILPVEVKESSKVGKSELKPLLYFMKKFKIKQGMLIYNGEEEELESDGYKIKKTHLLEQFLKPIPIA